MHGEALAQGVRDAHWLQLWINPGVHKKPLPKASMEFFKPDEIPVHDEDGLNLRVVIGEAFNKKSPALSAIPMQLLHVKMQPHCEVVLAIPHKDWRGFIYVVNGRGTFGASGISGDAQECLLLADDSETELPVKADSSTLEFVVATGKPVNHSWFKLLCDGGSLIDDSPESLYAAKKRYELNEDKFGD
jgi:redox-sensitive bicupin YhaK (pirin superfamily)